MDQRRIARFDGPPPPGMASVASRREVETFLRGSEGPAVLAVEVHASMRQRIDGVQEDVEGLHAAVGRFTIRDGRRAARVLLFWLPIERFWVLSVSPVREHRKRRREQDLGLVLELVPHLDEILAARGDVSRVVWMTEEEAEAHPLGP